MHCPKCKAQMDQVALAEGVADRCPGCQGLWFDLLEHEDMKKSAQVLDIGSAEAGTKYNNIDRIHCPVCPNTQMLRMVDAQQPHIWFESCPVCYGRFYDAGEFRDFADFSFSDLIKRFKAVPRE